MRVCTFTLIIKTMSQFVSDNHAHGTQFEITANKTVRDKRTQESKRCIAHAYTCMYMYVRETE